MNPIIAGCVSEGRCAFAVLRAIKHHVLSVFFYYRRIKRSRGLESLALRRQNGIFRQPRPLPKWRRNRSRGQGSENDQCTPAAADVRTLRATKYFGLTMIEITRSQKLNVDVEPANRAGDVIVVRRKARNRPKTKSGLPWRREYGWNQKALSPSFVIRRRRRWTLSADFHSQPEK